MYIRKRFLFYFLLFHLLTGKLYASDYDDDLDEMDDLPHVEILLLRDLQDLLEKAGKQKKIIMLEVSASYCDYCVILEDEIIKPMLRSGDYENKVFIRQLQADSYFTMIGLNGESTTHAELGELLNIQLTPTLIFIDSNASEISQRILGVNSLDFFGAYVDEAIDNGLKQIGH